MLEGFRVQNFGVLRDVKIGRLSNDRSGDPMKLGCSVTWKR